MKRMILAMGLALMLLTAGARGEAALRLSNLADGESASQVRAAMAAAGIGEEDRDAFFENVRYFNEAIKRQGLVMGFVRTPMPDYDQEGMQALWGGSSPDFPGINCRLTAYGLYGQHLKLGGLPAGDTGFLFMDRESIQTNPYPVLTEGEAEDFFRFYAVVPTVDSRDPAEHLRILLAEWHRRGVRFDESSPARLISVVIHSRFSEDENELFVGHTGILLPEGDGGLLFIEKLAFQLPYQAIRFESRAALRAYLTGLYDDSRGQPSSPPLILENDRLMGPGLVPHRKQ